MLALALKALPWTWRAGMAAAAIAVFVGGVTATYLTWKRSIYKAGFEAASAQCQENEMRGERDALRQQLEATKKQLADQQERARSLEGDTQSLRGRVAELNAELEKEAHDAAPQGNEASNCTYGRVGPALRGRLCNSWGIDCGLQNGGPGGGK